MMILLCKLLLLQVLLNTLFEKYVAKYGIELHRYGNTNIVKRMLDIMDKKDVDYVVKSNEIIIVDEFTGRLMPGRRYSDGLHGV